MTSLLYFVASVVQILTAALHASQAFIRSLSRSLMRCLWYLFTLLYLSEVIIILPLHWKPLLFWDLAATLEKPAADMGLLEMPSMLIIHFLCPLLVCPSSSTRSGPVPRGPAEPTSATGQSPCYAEVTPPLTAWLLAAKDAVYTVMLDAVFSSVNLKLHVAFSKLRFPPSPNFFRNRLISFIPNRILVQTALCTARCLPSLDNDT